MGASGPNSFPVFLKVQPDGSTTAEIRQFEDFVKGAGTRIGQGFAKAAQTADAAFNFAGARKAIDGIASEVQRLGKLQSQKFGDPFGIVGSVANLRNSPIQRLLNEQAAASSSLDAQRQRAHAQRMSEIQQEFDAAIGAVRQRRAAEAAAIDDIIARENSLVALDRQRTLAQAQMVSGRTFIQAPSFDPTGTAQDAQAAQRHAIALNQLATAAERVAAVEAAATATDRAYAAQLRTSATAAQQEAERLQALAATQGRVAGAVGGLNKANLDLQSSQRASRFATLQASQQFQDFFIQIGAGTNPVVAFTQQASQLAFVMSAAGGTAGKFAKFMSGAGGTVAFALLAVIPLVGTLIGKLGEQNDAVEKAIDKKRKDLEQTEAEIDADHRWAQSIDGVVDAILRRRKALDQAQQQNADVAAQGFIGAQKELDALNQGIEKAKRAFADLGGDSKISEIQKSIVATRATASGDPGAALASTALLERQLKELKDAKSRLDQLQKQVEGAQKNVTDATVQLGAEQGKAMADLAANAALFSKRFSDALTGKNGVFDKRPELAGSSTQILASVERLSTAMQHAAAQDVKFGDTETEAKKLGLALQDGTLKATPFAAAMDKLAASLEAVAKAAEEAKKHTTAVTQFQLPVQGTITGKYGDSRPGHLHQGVDIAVPVGTDVHAAAAGTIIEAGVLPGYGNVIFINHGSGTISRYAHLSSLLAQKGQEVGAGQVIGLSGGAKGAPGAGDSTGPHVHFEVLRGGKAVNPLKLAFPTDALGQTAASEAAQERAAQAAERAADQMAEKQRQLANESDTLAERVQRINEQWNEQPKLIDQAAAAHRQLLATIQDATQLQGDYNAEIAKLQKEKPPGFEGTVKQLEASRDALNGVIDAAQKAGPVIDEGMLKPIEDITKAAQRQKQIDDLVLAGKKDQATALQQIFELEDKLGEPLKLQAEITDLIAQGKTEEAAQLERALKAEQAMIPVLKQQAAADRLRQEALERQNQLIGRVVNSANNFQNAVTSGIEGLLKDPTDVKGLKASLKSITDQFRHDFAQSIGDTLLGGDLGQQMESALRAKSDPLGQAGSDLTQSAGDLSTAASDLVSAANQLSSAGGPSAGELGSTPTAFAGADLTSLLYPQDIIDLLGGIDTNTGDSAVGSTDLQNILQHQTDLQKRSALLSNPEDYYNLLGSKVGSSIDKALGTNFFGKIGGKLGTIMEGAQLGQMSGQLLGLFGKRFQSNASNIGSTIGGGLGMLVGGPVGAIIGGLLGGLAGGLLGKKKKEETGVASIGSDNYNNFQVSDSKGTPSRKQESSKDINNVIDALEGLAQQLGVVLDASKGSVSIGVQGDDFRVDTTGKGNTNKNIPGVLNFGSDEQGAIEAAIKDLINDGVLGPIREGTKKLLLESRNLQAGITKALKFENVFKELKQYTDPVGAAIDDLDQQFNELRRIFAEAGASAEEYAQLEELYAFKRADAIKAATQQLDSTLTQLLHDLTYSGDTGLSLKTRQQNALAQLAPFQQQIASGQPIDQEAFAQVVQSLLQIEREMYGSTATYFNMLSMLTQLTQQAISNAGQPVTVPAVTGTPMTPTSSPTTPTSYPVPTGTPSGSPITAPAVPPNVAAANDNYATAQQIIATINKQTQDLIAAGLDQAKMTTAVQTGVTNALTLLAANSNDTEALTTAVQTGNDKIVGALTSLIGISSQQNTLMQAGFNRISGNSQGTVGIAGEVPYWEAPGAGMYFSEWAG